MFNGYLIIPTLIIVCVSIPLFTILMAPNKKVRYVPIIIGVIYIISLLILDESDGSMDSVVVYFYAALVVVIIIISLSGLLIYKKIQKKKMIVIAEKEDDVILKYFLNFLIPMITAPVLVLIYYVFFTYPDGYESGFAPRVILPLVVLGTPIALVCIWSFRFFNSKIISMVIIVVLLPLTAYFMMMEVEIDYITDHYYKTTENKTLLGMPMYQQAPGNYITVAMIGNGEGLRGEGIFHEIEEGYGSEARIGDTDISCYQIYRIDSYDYVVVDWKTREVVDRLDYRESKNLIEAYLDENNLYPKKSDGGFRFYGATGFKRTVYIYPDQLMDVDFSLDEDMNIKLIFGEMFDKE